jgi:shikimate dehydrogenase
MSPEQINFAVAGMPVSHSLSPILFLDYIFGTGLRAKYSRILTDSIEDLSEIIEGYDIQGFNITAPLKEKSMELCNQLSSEAIELEAVNTIVRKNLESLGYNTDIYGVESTLADYLDKKVVDNALIIGAGGASKAVIKALKNLSIKGIYVFNRTETKSQLLASKFRIQNFDIDKHVVVFDLIINTAPAFPQILNSLNFSKGAIVFDANYKICPLQQFSIKNNFTYIDGKNWLLNQGRISYELMTGIENSNFELNNEILKHKTEEPKLIALIGMMGTGKSTIGKKLAELTGFEFVDMDKTIENEQKMSITEIFLKHGEDYFRLQENQILKRLIKRKGLIISTGGGIVTNDENIKLLKDNCWNILLHGSIENISKNTSDKNRPLIAGKDKFQQMTKLFNERKNNYFYCSDVIVNTFSHTFVETSEIIYDDYSKSFIL